MLAPRGLVALAKSLKHNNNVRCMSTLEAVLGGFLGEHPGQIPVTEEFDGVPETRGQARAFEAPQLTTLANGLRVVSQETHATSAVVNVTIGAGSRAEDEDTEGISHTLQRAALKSTESRSHLRVVRDMEDAGVTAKASFSRDSLVYSGSSLRDGSSDIVAELGDAVVNPLYAEWEVDAWQDVMAAYDYDISSHDNLLELAYAAAYLDDSPLGHSKFCPSYKVGSFSAAALRDFVGAKFTADNIVISASGVNHNNFVRDVSQAFGGLASGAVTAAPAKYLGGEYRVRGPGNVAYFALSFEAPSASASLKDLAAVQVLHAALGATLVRREGLGNRGSRFAALGDDVSAHATSAAHADTGLFTVAAAASRGASAAAFDAIAGAVKEAFGGSQGADAFARAKNQAKRTFLENAEQSANAASTLGDQVFLADRIVTTADAAAAFDSLTADDVRRVGETMLAGAPSVAASGAIGGIPRFDKVASFFA